MFQSEGTVENTVLYVTQEMVSELTKAQCWVSFLCFFIKNLLQWHNLGALLDKDAELTFLTSIPSTQAGFNIWIQTWIQILQIIHTSVYLYKKLNFNRAYSSLLIQSHLISDLTADPGLQWKMERFLIANWSSSRRTPNVQNVMMWVGWFKKKTQELEGSPFLGFDFSSPHSEIYNA